MTDALMKISNDYLLVQYFNTAVYTAAVMVINYWVSGCYQQIARTNTHVHRR